MMLGVVFHSAYVYIPDANFLITSPAAVDYARPLAAAIHAFRMHAFFAVSGYFCVLTLRKYGWRKFLRVRAVRILIPLVVTGVTLNSLQVALVTSHTMADFTLRDYLLEGKWVSHLWFLVNLLVYFLIAALLMCIAERPLIKIGRRIINWVITIPVVFIILLLPFATISIYVAKTLGFPLESSLIGVFDTSRLLLYSPFFIFGALLAGEEKLLTRFAGINPAITVVMLVAAYYARGFSEGFSHFTQTVASVYLNSLTAWLGTALCFYVFRTFFNKRSGVWLFLSDAAYTVYLFHLVVVISVGIVLIRLNVNALVGLPVLILTTASVHLAIHAFVVRKSRVARLLYNGK